jgi:uncharacterized protein (TIGR04255 family)
MTFVYKNAPLVHASFEARFPGELSIETKRDLFQKAVQHKYPKLYVPHADPEKAPPLQHYHFRRDDNSAVVGLAINSFMYTSFRYPGFPAFRQDIEDAWGFFSNLFDVPTFTRLGLRYVNKLPIIRDEHGRIPLAKYVTTKLDLAPGINAETIHDLELTVTAETDYGRLRVAMMNEKGDGDLETLLLDLDFYRRGPIPREDRGSFIDASHEQVERAFLELISQEYKDIMKGGS